jgi:cell division protein FtsZ
MSRAVHESRAGSAAAAAEEGEQVETSNYLAVIKVVGVGGGGTNAVNRMVDAGVRGVEFIAVNTDAQALSMCDADVKIHIGGTITKGLGAGADPRVGRDAAEDSREELKEAVRGADMVFVTAGEGGGTGTGGAPIIAQIAREQGALTVGVVTRPFAFEGAQRTRRSEEGIAELRKQVDSVIVIPNERLIQVVERRTSIIDAFRMADDVLRQGVQGITDLITVPGLINLDFADVRTIMQDAGASLMGIGTASGENRASEAAKAAISSPLLETTVAGATGVLLNITGGSDLGLFEIDEAAGIIRQAAHDDCNVIFGAVIDEGCGDQLRVTVIATGFDATEASGVDSPPRFGRRETPREPARTAARPAATGDNARPPVLDAEERKEFEISDDALEIPDFLKER